MNNTLINRVKTLGVAMFIVVMGIFASVTPADAAISYGSVESSQNGTVGTSLTINKPSSAAVGDVLIAGIVVNCGSWQTITEPAGWTLIQRTDRSNDVGLATYYHVVTGTEGSSFTWNLSSGFCSERAAGGIIRYTGVDTSSPIDVVSSNTGDSGDATASSVTTTQANDMVVVFYGVDDDRSFATPSGTTERFDIDNISSSGPGSAGSDFVQASAGATGSKTSDIGGFGFDPWVAQMIALKEGTTGPSITYHSSSSAQNDSGTDGDSSLVINKPAGTVSGDFLFAGIVFNEGNALSVTPPSGWTLIRREDHSNDVGVATYYKWAGSSEPSSYTWSLSPSINRRAAGGIIRYSGVDTASPIDAASDDQGSSESSGSAGVTTTSPNAQVVLVYGLDDDGSFSTPGGTVERYDIDHSSFFGPAVAAFDHTQAAPGWTGTHWSNFSSGSDDWVSVSVALRVSTGDVTPPNAINVTSTLADGTYAMPNVITVDVDFDENVIVTGTPRLLLETGATDRYADYTGGSGGSTLTFSYTIQPNDMNPDLDYVATDSLELNGGTIQDAAANDAVLTLPTPGASGSLGFNKNLSINAVGSSHYPPTGQLDDPNGGEVWAGGSSQMIFWGASGTDVRAVNLLLSTDSGVTFPTTIASDLPHGAGFYSWTVAGDIDTTTARVRLEVLDGYGGVLATDDSDADFTIENDLPEPLSEPLPPEPVPDGMGGPAPFNPQGMADSVLTINENQEIPYAPDGTPHICTPGMLMIGSTDKVYYCGRDIQKYVFPNPKTYFTWYPEFEGTLVEVTDELLDSIPDGGIVFYRPGVKMLTVPSSNMVYAVGRNGLLHLVPDEATAELLYGSGWQLFVDDIPEQYFALYTMGDALDTDGSINTGIALRSGDTLWSAVTREANKLGVEDDILTLAREVAKANDLAVPEWNIKGLKNARSLKAGSRLDLAPLFDALRNR